MPLQVRGRPRRALAQLLLVATASAWNLLGGLRRKDIAPDASPANDRVKRVAQIRIPVSVPAQKGAQRGMPGAEGARVWVEEDAVIAQVDAQRFTLLRGLADGLSASEAPEDEAPSTTSGGAFLSLRGSAEKSEHRLSLGALECERLLAGARTKRWWMGPAFGAAAADVPPETQFLLCQLSTDAYALMLPLVRAPLRCTLDGSKGAHGDELQLLCQSGDTAVRAREMEDALYIGVGDDPYALLQSAFE